MQQQIQTATRVSNYTDTKQVDSVIRNYKQERWIQNTDRIGKEDSLSAWWSIEEMEDFISEAKNNGADGLKFYFGAYGSHHQETPEYADRQTLVMVGTKETATGVGFKNKDLYVQTEFGTNILANCNAVLCPPRCGDLKPFGLDDDTLGITIIDRGEKGMLVL